MLTAETPIHTLLSALSNTLRFDFLNLLVQFSKYFFLKYHGQTHLHASLWAMEAVPRQHTQQGAHSQQPHSL